MLQLRVFGASARLTDTAARLDPMDGVHRVLVIDAVQPDSAVLWADIRPFAADAFAVGAWSRGFDALEVLGVNVACLLLSGSLTLAAQQWAAGRYNGSGRR